MASRDILGGTDETIGVFRDDFLIDLAEIAPAATTVRGNADKEAVIAAVRARGFDPADDNEADALALLDWALARGGRQ